MLDFVRRAGAVRLKLLLLILCIAAAGVFIYVRLRPPEPARIAPGYSPGIGRSAARSADRLTDDDPSSEQAKGKNSRRSVRD